MTAPRTLDLDRTPFAGLDRLAAHMTHHADRQSVIASNLANIDTPGYRPQDVDFAETIAAQVDADGPSRTMSFETTSRTADDEVPDQDGNTVSLEGQMAKMSSNLVRFRSLGELLSRRIGLLRYAATDGNR